MPPTGLADGFGQEVPYEARPSGGRRSDSPRKGWVPGSARCGFGGRTLPAGLGPSGTYGPGNELATDTGMGAIVFRAMATKGTYITITV
ncbi:hypothetical protein Pth03_42720 [Planotetraspora thailandica]|uniref:Uncharacterized protein n=1 Tax=Planotetraspora thailandica TaxID=487172 RepID=A0A8J3V328_9ACTN|nr:hypothetical protein Pth03_42720 [Planotetraspora thailandica]